MKNLAKLIVALTISMLSANGQILTDFPCYAVAKNNGDANVLYGYLPNGNEWERISPTQTKTITAIAADSNNQILYAFESKGGVAGNDGAFGLIDNVTRDFMAIGSPGIGTGDYGPILLNNVTGLTYQNSVNIMFAVHSIEGEGGQTNDLLFRIDPANGKVIKNAMINGEEVYTDYVVLEKVIDYETGDSFNNVSDVAVHPRRGELYIVYEGLPKSYVCTINSVDGTINSLIYASNLEYIKSLGFNLSGDLYGFTGNIGADKNVFFYVDPVSLENSIFPFTAKNGIDVDFESFDCFNNLVNFGNCASNGLISGNEINNGLYQSFNISDDANKETKIRENSTVVVAAEASITFKNILVPASSNFTVEIRPCGL